MKLTLFTLLAICLVAVCRTADTEYDYEEEIAAAVPAAPASAKPTTVPKAGKLGVLLSPRTRGAGPLAARKSPAAAPPATPSTKSTTTTEAPAEQLEEEYDEEGEEGAKQDVVTTTTSTEPPKKLGRGGVVRPFRSHSSGRVKSGNANEVPKSTSRVRFGVARGKAAASPAQEEAQETRSEDVQLKSKAYRRG